MFLMMVYDTQDYWVFGLHPSFSILKNTANTMLQKLDLFPSSVEGVGVSTLLGLLKRANLNHWTKISSFQ
jgi:hypothetical protein